MGDGLTKKLSALARFLASSLLARKYSPHESCFWCRWQALLDEEEVMQAGLGQPHHVGSLIGQLCIKSKG